MWPWEHAAIGYLLYSIGLRLLGREPPSGTETASIVLMSVLPDLLDKPLSWGLHLTPSGYGALHSVFVAFPLGVGILLVTIRRDRYRLGAAALVGYWGHLVADVLSPLRTGGHPIIDRVLWPIVDTDSYPVDYGVGRGLVYLREFGDALLAMPLLEVFAFYLAIPTVTVGLWILDGMPGSSIPRRALAALRHSFG